MTTTPETIAELKRLMAEATPRPWYRTGPLDEEETGVAGGVRMGLLSEPDGDEAKQTDLIDDPKESDYDLIAAAVNSLPDLLADLEAAQRRLDHEAVMATRYANEAGALEGQLDYSRKREQVLREALQLISQRHPGYGGSGEIARKALAATEVQP